MGKKCVVQNVTQLLLLRHLQSSLCTIIQRRHVISQTFDEGTGASEAGLILQRSIQERFDLKKSILKSTNLLKSFPGQGDYSISNKEFNCPPIPTFQGFGRTGNTFLALLLSRSFPFPDESAHFSLASCHLYLGPFSFCWMGTSRYF